MTTFVNRNELNASIPVPILGLNTLDDKSQMNPLMAPNFYNCEMDDPRGIAKRSGFTRFNTGMLPITFTGTITSITTQSVGAATGVVWSGVVTAGLRFRMASGTNIYTVSGLANNATLTLTSSFVDTVNTGSYYISSDVRGLAPFKYGTTQKLVAFADASIFNLGTGASGEPANLNDTLTSGTRFSWTTFQDKFYYCNGYEFNTWDGATTIAAVGGTPAPDDPLYVTTYVNGNATWLVIVGSNTQADMSDIAFSDVNAPGTWPAANIYPVGDRDGGRAIAAKQCPSGLLIFKTNGIYMFGGIPGSSGSLRRVSSIGCNSPHSIVEYEGAIYFVGDREGRLGVFRYIGGNTIQSLADSIEPSLADLKKSVVNQICGSIYDNKYYISGTSSTGTFNDRHFICYINRPFEDAGRMFFPWAEGSRGYNFLSTVDISGTDYLFSGSPTTGYVYREDNGETDDTTDNIFGNAAAIDAYVTTKFYDFGVPAYNKELLRAYVNINAVGAWGINLDVYKDFQTYGYDRYPISVDTNALTWAEVVFGVTPWQTAVGKTIAEVTFRYPQTARYFQFKWSNATASQYFTVFPMNLFFKQEAN